MSPGMRWRNMSPGACLQSRPALMVDVSSQLHLHLHDLETRASVPAPRIAYQRNDFPSCSAGGGVGVLFDGGSDCGGDTVTQGASPSTRSARVARDSRNTTSSLAKTSQVPLRRDWSIFNCFQRGADRTHERLPCPRTLPRNEPHAIRTMSTSVAKQNRSRAVGVTPCLQTSRLIV